MGIGRCRAAGFHQPAGRAKLGVSHSSTPFFEHPSTSDHQPMSTETCAVCSEPATVLCKDCEAKQCDCFFCDKCNTDVHSKRRNQGHSNQEALARAPDPPANGTTPSAPVSMLRDLHEMARRDKWMKKGLSPAEVWPSPHCPACTAMAQHTPGEALPALAAMKAMLNNIVTQPLEPKFRRIRYSNAFFARTVLPVPAGVVHAPCPSTTEAANPLRTNTSACDTGTITQPGPCQVPGAAEWLQATGFVVEDAGPPAGDTDMRVLVFPEGAAASSLQ
eukprot:gene9097-1634_t